MGVSEASPPYSFAPTLATVRWNTITSSPLRRTPFSVLVSPAHLESLSLSLARERETEPVISLYSHPPISAAQFIRFSSFVYRQVDVCVSRSMEVADYRIRIIVTRPGVVYGSKIMAVEMSQWRFGS